MSLPVIFNHAVGYTVEFYTVDMLLTLTLIIIIIPAKARDYVFTGVGLSVCYCPKTP